MTPIDRRSALTSIAAAFAMPQAARALDRDPTLKPPSVLFVEALAALSNGREITHSRVTIDLPRLAENGNSITLKVTVDSPMTAADHVKTITLLSEQNPIAVIGRFHLQPRAGRAFVSTSIRLATTQNVHAIAEMSDGTLWSDAAQSVVLIAACIDGG